MIDHAIVHGRGPGPSKRPGGTKVALVLIGLSLPGCAPIDYYRDADGRVQYYNERQAAENELENFNTVFSFLRSFF